MSSIKLRQRRGITYKERQQRPLIEHLNYMTELVSLIRTPNQTCLLTQTLPTHFQRGSIRTQSIWLPGTDR